ncbi:MAG: DUF3300 domain-containing protein [Woeseiaceae bacterium]|nr:DUF3300 domain-containing protein [Woeseiaceae bacterium]
MKYAATKTIAFAALTLASTAYAQVPVDDDGNEIGSVYSSESDAALLSNAQLEELVGPIALYPDELLAIVLPASTYPLQIVEAARFLEDVEDDSSLEPDEDWDDSIVALLNYPEVIELLNEDLDWTWTLGEAVVAQQGDVLTAVESFRDRAYAAGNLQTDEYQVIEENDEGIIEISPVSEDVIYVPYYEPERVVVYQTQPVYHYYARPYPVYYYPYSYGHVHYGAFWGVTTAFTIGWLSDSLHVWHHSHYGHPYYGRYYRDYWWYRRPSIHVHNSIYYGGHSYSRRHYRYGDYWRPRYDRRHYSRDQRITRSRYYPNSDGRRSRGATGSQRDVVDRSVTRRSGNVSQVQRDRRDRAANDNRRRNTVTRSDTRRSDAASETQRSQRQRADNSTRRNDVATRPSTTQRRSNFAASTNDRSSNAVTRRTRDERVRAMPSNSSRDRLVSERRNDQRSSNLRHSDNRVRQNTVRQSGQRPDARVNKPAQRVERSYRQPQRSAPAVRRAPPQRSAPVAQSKPSRSHSSAPAPRRAESRPSRSSAPERRSSRPKAQSSQRERGAASSRRGSESRRR